jgi:hypothetical protein
MANVFDANIPASGVPAGRKHATSGPAPLVDPLQWAAVALEHLPLESNPTRAAIGSAEKEGKYGPMPERGR